MTEKEQQSPSTDNWTPPLPSYDVNAAFEWWSSTHVFLEWAEDGGIYPCFGIHPFFEDTLAVAKKHKDFHAMELFTPGTENNDRNRFDKIVWMRDAFLHFFKDVFEVPAYQEGYLYFFDLKRIGLPKQTCEAVMKVITEYGLNDYLELIFFIIAKAQGFYNKNVFLQEAKNLPNIQKEANKAIEVIEKVVRGPFDKRVDDELLRINFIFKNSPTTSISDPYYTRQFVESFKKDLNAQYYKDWKLQLRASPFYYAQNNIREQFKYRYAIALYNFFTETQLIKIYDKPYPNYLMECIYEILQFSLINVGKQEHKKADKIKLVRHWIVNHHLIPTEGFQKSEVNLEKLYKYFEKEFIDCVGETKSADAVNKAFTLCIKYKMQKLQKEITHVLACLKEWRPRIAQQLEQDSPSISKNPVTEEFETFKLFLKSVLKERKFENISFSLEGETQTHSITNDLLIYFAQSAIRNHYNDFREDYEFDLLHSEIKNLNQDGSFSLETTGNFNSPEDRFLPKFVNSFFSFLQAEAPQLDGEYKPADRYYLLIAEALYLTGFFLSQFPEEREMKSKVQHWHKLGK